MNRKLTMNLLLLIALLTFALPALAQQDPFANAPTTQEMGDNFRGAIDVFWIVIQAVIALIGFVLVAMGLHGFYQASDNRGGGQSSVGKSFAGVLFGVLMILLPLTVGTLGKSIFGDKAARPQAIQLAPEG